MLVLDRKEKQQIKIGADIVITVMRCRGDAVKIGIEAPREIPVHRMEVVEAIQRNGPRIAADG